MQEVLRDFPLVMGVINLSGDSFWKGSSVLDSYQFEKRVEEMVEEGADIIDIGACSTRPGSISATLQEEWSLLAPILTLLKKREVPVKISIDTFRSEVVIRAFDMVGEFIVNDISAGEDDSKMLESVGGLKLPYIAMHKRGTPLTMQQNCNYENVVEEVQEYLKNSINRASSYGIEQVVVDPGFGFAKTVEQNYTLLNSLSTFKFLKEDGKSTPLLVGLSRKSMIYKYLNIDVAESLSATSALQLLALLNGADIIRVHDVKEARQMVELYKIISKTKE